MHAKDLDESLIRKILSEIAITVDVPYQHPVGQVVYFLQKLQLEHHFLTVSILAPGKAM